jgi:C1A family cysteine protease
MTSLKRSKISKLINWIIGLFVGVSIFINPSWVLPQQPYDLTMAPVNPAFINYIWEFEKVKDQLATSDGYNFGLIPSPLDLSHLRGQTISKDPHLLLALPSSYDLRTQGKLTSIRDQRSCGACWAFASYGSVESNLLPSESWDFSENNLKNTHGFDWEPCEGGNADIAMAYLARRSGPVNELDDPYNPYSSISPTGLPFKKHLNEVFILPDREGPLDNNHLKEAIMKYGAVYTQMFWNPNYYHSSYKTYYYGGTEFANHAVALVGWDDQFDRNKFRYVPPGDGAFIVRNSWGTGFGENGYFYVSYYDVCIGEGNYVFYRFEDPGIYTSIYQYDPLGWTGSAGYGNNTAWFSNIFVANSNDPLLAVSFYTSSLNSSYEVYVYHPITSGPRTGSLRASKTGTIFWPGYHTISLDSPVPLTPGQKFSVVVKLNTPGYVYPIPVEIPYSNYSSQARANAGESYISSDGVNWQDITSTSWCSECNVCLKALSGPPAAYNDKIGIFRSGSWYLDNNGNGMWDNSSVDLFYTFGLATDVPIWGDWNGDGRKKIGVRRGSTWYLDYNGNGIWDGCTIDRCLNFGLSTDLPVVGDWNGSGNDKIGVFRGGKWYLDFNGNGFWDAGDRSYTFGLPMDIPIVGDWSGNGISKIGVRREASWYLDYNGDGSWSSCVLDRCYERFGLSTDIPVVGDWSGNRISKIGVKRGSNWYLDQNGDGTWNDCVIDRCLTFGLPDDKPVAGDW